MRAELRHSNRVCHQPAEDVFPCVTQNPFSQQRIERLSYRFPDGGDWASNLQRLKQLNFRALVVGGHGTGKSTLIRELQLRLSGEELAVRPITEPLQIKTTARRTFDESIDSVLLLDVPRIDRRCSTPSRYRVRSRRQQRSLLADQLRDLDSGTLLLVDGIERLTWLERQWLVHRTASEHQAAGLIAIVHHRLNLLRLPVWIETAPTQDLLVDLVDDLLAEQPESMCLPIQHRARILFQQHRRNIRDTLRQLFDEWSSL